MVLLTKIQFNPKYSLIFILMDNWKGNFRGKHIGKTPGNKESQLGKIANNRSLIQTVE